MLEKGLKKTSVQFYYGNKIITLSVELTIVPTNEIAN